jgi:hypothetical protein
MVIAEKNDGVGHWRTGDAYANAGRWYLVTGKPAKAEIYYQQELERWTRMLGPAHRALVPHLAALAASQAAAHEPAKAAGNYQLALVIAEKAYGPQAFLLAPLLEHYAKVLRTQQREMAASAALARATAIRKGLHQ